MSACSFLLLYDIFSEGIQQGKQDSSNGTPLRGAGSMRKGQMAFSGPAGVQ